MATYVATNIYHPELDMFLIVCDDKVFDLKTITNIATMHQYLNFTDAVRHCYENCDSILSRYDTQRLIKTSLVIPHNTHLIRSDKNV